MYMYVTLNLTYYQTDKSLLYNTCTLEPYSEPSEDHDTPGNADRSSSISVTFEKKDGSDTWLLEQPGVGFPKIKTISRPDDILNQLNSKATEENIPIGNRIIIEKMTGVEYVEYDYSPIKKYDTKIKKGGKRKTMRLRKKHKATRKRRN